MDETIDFKYNNESMDETTPTIVAWNQSVNELLWRPDEGLFRF